MYKIYQLESLPFVRVSSKDIVVIPEALLQVGINPLAACGYMQLHRRLLATTTTLALSTGLFKYLLQ